MKKKKALLAVLSIVAVLGAQMNVCAAAPTAGENEASHTAAGSQNCEVTNATTGNPEGNAASYTIIVPKKIVLDQNGQAKYQVKFQGDIDGARSVKVTIPGSFNMSQAGKAAVTMNNWFATTEEAATGAQASTYEDHASGAQYAEWKPSYTGSPANKLKASDSETTTAYGKISPDSGKPSAGVWTGTFDFTIEYTAAP